MVTITPCLEWLNSIILKLMDEGDFYETKANLLLSLIKFYKTIEMVL